MAEANSHLRNRPRQARSAARVELLLDVAAEVFEEVGYDAATTNLVAARADVPVGTLYRWFPDKAALAEALTDRYLAHLVDLYADLLGNIGPEERIGEFLHRVIDRLVAETRDQRALPALLVSAMVPGGRSGAGQRLREGLLGHIRALIELRVPGLPEPIVARTSEVMVTLAHLVLAAAADQADPDREATTAEYVDVMLAYLEAKFPVAGHHAWSDPDVAVKPVYAAPDRAARLATSGD
ncbi:TetR/AcrR family transcriptional regulator [Aquihabitans sp. G128]|uniref:TetR/AcrR family transcriptional regulator n=1 Tax=Aquihabitans sp. G128 TaxID=2849779 RepID=UPI001C22C166|nr:TetR/AcrR family transcriptional regulator [Aquihabitans sp. G128]QXC60359.1 TetR/AcrR family transcriptional regulator [Aquihabitans sp. G128]